MKTVKEILEAIHRGDYDNDDGELCDKCLNQVFKDLDALVPKKKEQKEEIHNCRSPLCVGCLILGENRTIDKMHKIFRRT